MKITYSFVNGEKFEIEVEDTIGKIIVDMDRSESSGERRVRYNERHIDTSLDHSSWNAWINPDVDNERQKRIEAALDSLTAEQKKLVEALYSFEPVTEAEFAAKKGVTQQAINNRVKKLRKKLKKSL